MKIFTGRFQSSTSDTRASSVSRLVSPWVPSGRQLSCQAPNSSSRSWARVIVLTKPAPVDVRSNLRSCTHTKWPSRVSRTSHSTRSAPSLSARLYAASVCSGRAADAPRWATTKGCPATTSSAHVIPLCCRFLPLELNRSSSGRAGPFWEIWGYHDPAMCRPRDGFAFESFEDPGHGGQRRRRKQVPEHHQDGVVRDALGVRGEAGDDGPNRHHVTQDPRDPPLQDRPAHPTV